MNNVIYAAAYFGVTLGAFLLGKYVFPKTKSQIKNFLEDLEKMDVISKWADKFVVWAREFLRTKTGEEKMAAVIEQLKQVAESAGMEVTEEQLKAIAQTAYESMKAGEEEAKKESALYQRVGDREVAKGSTVNVYAGTVAVATDNVSDGALQDNPDGSVNAYDETGEKVGTVSAEEAEEAARNVGVIATEDNG